MLLYGDAFWPTYTTGDNTGLVATDSMKNFIQWETANFDGAELPAYCRFLAEKFLAKYPQTEGIQVAAVEIPYEGAAEFVPRGTERAMARIEMTPRRRRRGALRDPRVQAVAARRQRLPGFVRDQYTTLPETTDRPLHMWLDLEWDGDASRAAQVRGIVHEVFRSFVSGSIQQVIYEIGTTMLAELPAVTEVRLEAEQPHLGPRRRRASFTDPRPPYGVLGLTLRR